MAAVTAAADPSARAGAGERVDLLTMVGPEADHLRKVAFAIRDGRPGSSVRLTRLVDDVSTWTAIVPGLPPHEFDDREEATEWASEAAALIQARAVAAVLAASASRSPATGGVAAEGFRARDLRKVMHGDIRPETHEERMLYELRNVDSLDCQWLMDMLPDSGHGWFWRAVAWKLRDELRADANSRAAPKPSSEAAPASPAETKATLADATFDLAAPTRRVEAGAVAGDLGGVEAALDRMLLTTWDEGAGICSAGSTKAAREAVLDAVRALLTPSTDAATLVDAYRTAVLDAAEADRCYYPDQASEDRCRQADRAEAVARLALDAHLAAKDRELGSLRRAGAAGDGVREAVPAELWDAIDALLTDQRVRSALEREPGKDWLWQTPVNLELLRAVSDARARSRILADDRAQGAQGREER